MKVQFEDTESEKSIRKFLLKVTKPDMRNAQTIYKRSEISHQAESEFLNNY